jgi:hypothetical protein
LQGLLGLPDPNARQSYAPEGDAKKSLMADSGKRGTVAPQVKRGTVAPGGGGGDMLAKRGTVAPGGGGGDMLAKRGTVAPGSMPPSALKRGTIAGAHGGPDMLAKRGTVAPPAGAMNKRGSMARLKSVVSGGLGAHLSPRYRSPCC